MSQSVNKNDYALTIRDDEHNKLFEVVYLDGNAIVFSYSLQRFLSRVEVEENAELYQIILEQGR